MTRIAGSFEFDEAMYSESHVAFQGQGLQKRGFVHKIQGCKSRYQILVTGRENRSAKYQLIVSREQVFEQMSIKAQSVGYLQAGHTRKNTKTPTPDCHASFPLFQTQFIS